jgi:hypothetical protein
MVGPYTWRFIRVEAKGVGGGRGRRKRPHPSPHPPPPLRETGFPGSFRKNLPVEGWWDRGEGAVQSWMTMFSGGSRRWFASRRR